MRIPATGRAAALRSRIHRSPSTSGKHSKTTTIGTFAVPKSGTYTVDCRSNGQPVHRASIDPPTPEWVSIDIAIGSALLLFGIAWPIYVFLRRRRFSRSGTLEIMSEVADF
ncbi:hypothetical protein [Nocardia arthritidis]|uniref:Uncharacterized protein n=1 Tax=Nocardia arthritidis TaxID=228602 RepID=A0A6G9YDX0_9NOCA|nr:hypothetical protein [Nocardia arthritidis]QIS11378.1 hypothetical protein F5544_17510 [Nocardia arthritidis]